MKDNYVYKDNKGRIGNFFFAQPREEQVLAIDHIRPGMVKMPKLSVKFFDDNRNFNASFSRAEVAEGSEEDDE